MILTLPDHQDLYVRSMGKALRVVAVATTVEEANAYMERHDNAALVAEFGELRLLADRYDQGIPIYSVDLGEGRRMRTQIVQVTRLLAAHKEGFAMWLDHEVRPLVADGKSVTIQPVEGQKTPGVRHG